MNWLIGGLGFLLLAGLLLRGFVNATVPQVKRGALWLLAGIVLGGLLALVLTGRIGQAIGLVLPLTPLLLPAVRRWIARRRFGAAAASPVSDVRTAMLDMRLDHASGTLSGRVLAGRFAGRELGEMSLPDCLELLAECHATDPESVPLLETWLDNAAPGWRQASSNPGEPPMDEAAALALLGLAGAASPEEIRAAHRRMMRTAHPDRGGDAAQAARLNQARDYLLGRRSA
jgi:hypothetical protein